MIYADLLKEAEQDLLSIQQESRTNKTIEAGYDMLHKVRMLKYVNKGQFTKIRTTYGRFTAQWKLDLLCEKGWLERRMENVYSTADKALPVLKAKGYNTDILLKKITGEGMINEIQNTEAFIRIMKIDHFKALMYPTFGIQKVWLRPDALLILHDEENKKYKLIFLEVEAKKPNWHDHIERKQKKYLKLAKDIEFYDKWKNMSCKLGFSIPDISTVKFSVSIIGNIQKNFGPGFNFTTIL